jgi:hypothetical protein
LRIEKKINERLKIMLHTETPKRPKPAVEQPTAIIQGFTAKEKETPMAPCKRYIKVIGVSP